MNSSFSLFVARRFLFSGKESRYISLVTLFSLFGMIIGVASLLVVLSVMNGFKAELEQNVLRLVPHGHIDGRGGHGIRDWEQLAAKVGAMDGVSAVSPLIASPVLLRAKGVMAPARMNAINLEQDVIARGLSEAVYQKQLEPSAYGLVIGYALARQLGVVPGDSVSVILPSLSITAAGAFPRQKRFVVSSVFYSGSSLDARDVFTSLEIGQKLFRLPDAVTSLRVQMDDRFLAPSIMSTLSGQFSEQYDFVSWQQDFAPLFSAVRMEKHMMSLLLLVIVSVAAFNIVSVLVMLVSEKKAGIAILRTLGVSRRQIYSIFFLQGVFVGLTGIVFGALSGWFVVANLEPLQLAFNHWMEGLSDGRFHAISLPGIWHWQDFYMVVSASLLLTIIVTLFPSGKAASIPPARILNGT